MSEKKRCYYDTAWKGQTFEILAFVPGVEGDIVAVVEDVHSGKVSTVSADGLERIDCDETWIVQQPDGTWKDVEEL